MAYPDNHPSIPHSIPSEEVVATVTVLDSEISSDITDTAFRKTEFIHRRSTRAQSNTTLGVHVFLTRADNKFDYTFGRQTRVDTNTRNIPDVPLPGTKIAKQQFKLVPDWEADTWRIDSMSETVCLVNDVPLQKLTPRTRRLQRTLPHVLYLNHSEVNRVVIHDLRIDIWLIKTPREVMTSRSYTADLVELSFQNVRGRNEQWAQCQYLPSPNQVSGRSWAVLHRFTGRSFVAKLFGNNTERRDEEFRMFNKGQVDASVVRYLQLTKISNIPVIITEPYEEFHSYASQRENIKALHPALRFAVATKLLRRLFSALEFLHFHGIVHGNVSRDSVLVHVVHDRVKQVLLVDYSSAYSFSLGEMAPKDAMIADGEAVVRLIDDCCDLWTLREAASANAQNENVMRKRTQEAARKCQLVERCCHDLFGPRGGSKTSTKGKKLLRLLELKEIDWHSAVAEQTHNVKLREVGYIFRPTLDAMRVEHTEAHGPPRLGEQHIWNLSLGHPYLDGLVTQLHHEQWNFTPREIGTNIKKIAGVVEDPWKTFDVTLRFDFDGQDAPASLGRKGQRVGRKLSALSIQSIQLWLAICCEIHQEWCLPIVTEATNIIPLTSIGITLEELFNLESALLKYGALPPNMHWVFRRLLELYTGAPRDKYTVEVTQKVWYHRPSRMFNITQLQRLASPPMLLTCIIEDTVKCDNFAEVRGSPELEGCYAPMAMLPAFLHGLGLTARILPDTGMLFPAHDPADFSQVLHHGRVVLARQGLLAYATIVRSGDQCCWHDLPEHGKDFETTDYFLPTYFGDANILPQLPPGGYHARPEHWSGFARYEPDNAKMKRRSGRHIIEVKSPAASAAAYRTFSLRPVQRIFAAPPTLSTILRQRETIRAAAFPKRKANLMDPIAHPSRRVRQRPAASFSVVNSPTEHAARRLDAPSFTHKTKPRKSQASLTVKSQLSLTQARDSFLGRLPSIGGRYDQSFTIPEGSFLVDNDWREVDQMLNEMPTSESAETSTGVFGFHINRSMHESDTELNTPSPPAQLPTIIEESPRGPTGKLRRNQSPFPDTPSSDLAPLHTPRSKSRSAWESFVAKRGPNRQQTQVATPNQSSPMDALPRFIKKGGPADVFSREPKPLRRTAPISHLGPSPEILDVGSYSSPAVALDNVGGRDHEDGEVSIPDTESWGSSEPAESVDEENDRAL